MKRGAPRNTQRNPTEAKRPKVYDDCEIKIKRYCLGNYCRGTKTFMSLGKHNRLCPECTLFMKGKE